MVDIKKGKILNIRLGINKVPKYTVNLIPSDALFK